MVDPDAPTGGAKPIPEVSEDGIKSQKKGKMGTGVNIIVIVIIITWCLMIRQYTPGSNVWSSGA